MQFFDLINAPLKGANLLEASAGTGKTFTIEGLFLRLIIEKNLPVGSILVVTYTVAATEELRCRIRGRLLKAAQAFAQGESADRLLAALLYRFADQQERRRVQELLQAALRDFDEAPIFTIHSFCQRTLQENAFESDALFDTEFLADEERLRREVVDDFWRSHFYETLPEVVGYVLARGCSPASLAALLRQVVSHPDMEIIPHLEPFTPEALRGLIAAYGDAFEEIKRHWPQVRQDIRGHLESSALHAGTYGRKAEGLCRAMDLCVDAGENRFPPGEHLIKFTPSYLAAKVKKNQPPPQHDFFQLCQILRDRAMVLEEELARYLLFLKTDFLVSARKKLAARKEEDNVMFFDDLLLRLRAAVEGKRGEELVRIIRGRYQAALIDEFQDTDSVQFAIFRTVFGQGDFPLFLIGDPKQAIYSFRGADIFAYMQAAAAMAGKYTIAENWRSEPGLIKAVNTLFSQRENPFVYREIAFSPTVPPVDKVQELLTLQGRHEAPCQWWFVPAEKFVGPGKLLPKGKVRTIIARAIAGETARLLMLARQGEVRIGNRSLQEGDIAVLVRQHREARIIQEALRRLNIPAVLQKAGHIFATTEAEELERVLRALAQPEENELVRAAMLTDMLGVGVAEMGRLAQEEGDWDLWRGKFDFYHRVWWEAGFMSAFTALLNGENIKPRLLAFPDGERRVTNLLHLAELLHRTSEEGKCGMMGLVKWLAEQRDQPAPYPDEHQLRLESDARAVQIVTVHQSKGLEYPIVFCPFTWEGSEVRGDAFSFHNTSAAGRIVFDLGSADADRHRSLAERELLAENVRLLYVSLTRAKHRCYFVWGRFNKAETSAPAYLFHDEQKSDGTEEGNALTTAIAANFEKLTDELMYRRLAEIASLAEGAIDLREVPTEAGEVQPLRLDAEDLPAFQPFSGNIDRSWRIVSFSSLTADRPQMADIPDYDGSLAVSPPPADYLEVFGAPREKFLKEAAGEDNIFSFPRGAEAGTLLHDILQRLDFQEKREAEVENLVSRKLLGYGFPACWEGVIRDLLGKVVTAPFLPFTDEEEVAVPFSLSAVDNAARLNELEFYFPLQRFTLADLQRIFHKAGLGFAHSDTDNEGPQLLHGMEQLHFNPLRGFMKGFMDMVFCHNGRFYLVDWKSNFLGNDVADYGPAGLARAMAEGSYHLQYHLYTLALHEYLSVRLPTYRYEKHFGGVYYVFLRGLGHLSGPEYGIYRDRPPAARIKKLAEVLIARH